MASLCNTYKTLQVAFTAPAVSPANGYLVKWRIVGDTNWNTVTQNQNPITIAGVPSCYNIEGSIQADCGGGNFGSPIVFAISSSSNICRQVTLLQTGVYYYVGCNSFEQVQIINNAATPQTICIKDGTLSGGTFTDLNTSCNI
jgi:hypothetical protein